MNATRSLGVALVVLLFGCSRSPVTTPVEVEADLLEALGHGADAQVIEAHLRERKLPFSYDRFANRYQSIIRDPDSDAHAITIYIRLDPDGRFAGVEARDSYTMP
jgi:hypothetical protein